MPRLLSIQVDYDQRVFGLDLMRAIAIINVVIVHAPFMDFFPDYPYVKLIPGVELFFVLSGFLIGNILQKTFYNTESYGFKPMMQFWVRRWFRTLPNYYLVLLINIVIVYFGVIHEDFSQFNWRFFLFVQNLYDGFYGFFWESWSLSIEEWFYLSFPIVLLLLYLVLKATKMKRKHIFLVNIIIYLCFSLVMRLVFGTRQEINDTFWYGVRIQKVIIYHLDGIAFGLLAAFIRYWYPEFWHKVRNLTFVLGLVCSYGIYYIPWDVTQPATVVLLSGVQSLGCFLLLPRFETLRRAPEWLRKPVTHISLVSYSMYLINLCMVSSVITANIQVEAKSGAILWNVVYWVAVFVVSTLMYKYYEKPIMDLRDRFFKKTEVKR